MDTTLHENICHNIATSKPTLHEKEFSLIPEGSKNTDIPLCNVPVLSPTTALNVSFVISHEKVKRGWRDAY